MNNTSKHALFQKEVILHLQKEYKGIRVWGIDSGAAFAKHSVKAAMNYLYTSRDINGAMKKLITISYGVVGHPDLAGIYFGRFIGIEIKTGDAVQSKEQKNFEKMIKDKNGIYLVVSNKYSIESQLKELDEMRELCSI